MKIVLLLAFGLLCLSCTPSKHNTRIIENFNNEWKFHLGDDPNASIMNFDDSKWRTLNVPHDWSIEEGYQNNKHTAASTGFVPGGIGWYRKTFKLPLQDQEKDICIIFDGIYNNSSVWINGHYLGKRPYGYSTFSYELDKYLNYGEEKNVIAVKVDRSAYVDSRWYTGSGIYRKVQLVKTNPIHVKQWGLQISTPEVSHKSATVRIKTSIENSGLHSSDNIELEYTVLDNKGEEVWSGSKRKNISTSQSNEIEFQLKSPRLWSVETPNLYQLNVRVLNATEVVDEVQEMFGVRWFKFDANKGFSLNGEPMKLKGVNLHHDAGAVGTAVPKAIWQYRVEKLKSIGVNAIRCSHNPHAIELLEVCDEIGMLVMDEAFDEWDRPKEKGIICLGDGLGSDEATRAYPRSFNKWAERDLKDLILRDYNHPSVFMWSIGNEIEWIYPYYKETFEQVNNSTSELFYYEKTPIYDSLRIKQTFDQIVNGEDTLVMFAKKLSNWVREMDNTRPVTCGSVHPSISIASGYAENIDVLGFNYRAVEYDAAHKAYPDLKILGSENWGNYDEWKSCLEREFVSGIFVWTGFAYLGEAGPWPRKGLNISFFDFAGFKNPRAHFYECLWVDKPKVYLCTVPVKDSEFSYNKKGGWKFDMNLSKPPVWNLLRLWEWYEGYDSWKYKDKEQIVVQAYSNCDEVELMLNGKSLGRKTRADYADDNIIKWLVPFNKGELVAKGYNKGKLVDEYSLSSCGEIAKIAIEQNKTTLKSGLYDASVITVKLLDENNNLVTDNDQEITFDIDGPGKCLGVDNGWERNTSPHKTNKVKTHLGKAVMFLGSTNQKGKIKVIATTKKNLSKPISLLVE